MADILAFFGVQPDSGDTTSPASVGDTLMWNGILGRWEWGAVTQDRLGNPESSVHYQVWRSAAASSPGSILSSLSVNFCPDPSAPTSGCWFYSVRAADSSGNVEGPSWTRSGTTL